MLGAQKPLHFRQGDERGQKLLRDLRGEQAVAILGEGRGVEHGLVDGKPNEPAKQKVKLDPLDQLALRADRIEKLQKRRPQQTLRRKSTAVRFDRKAPKTLGRVRPGPRSSVAHRPQRMLRRCPRLQVNVREQRPARPTLASHRPLAIRQPTAQQNHATTTNTSIPAPHFFSTRLGRDGARPKLAECGVRFRATQSFQSVRLIFLQLKKGGSRCLALNPTAVAACAVVR
jgi:hypothetical protein